jgi:hypothetical protein
MDIFKNWRMFGNLFIMPWFTSWWGKCIDLEGATSVERAKRICVNSDNHQTKIKAFY